jgi:predicted flap endonuclease-1-like 5' DNA nuclease
MMIYKRTFSPLIYLGLTAIGLAVGGSMIAHGTLFCDQPFLCALRRLGFGMTASGFILWIAACRACGDKPSLNGLFNITVPMGLSLLVASLILYQQGFSASLSLAGLATIGGALVVGLLADVFDPAHPCPVSQSWPEGGEHIPNPCVPAIENWRPQGHPVLPEDLTRIRGIGPRIQDVLYEAGMVTYLDIAIQSPERLETILVDEYQLKSPIDPSSWPEQAQLAAHEKWRSLARMQQQLSQN